jgi:1D-myo-inositol-tetrakisphosphate 5-kinase/inositol-polyphosphate multikinase
VLENIAGGFSKPNILDIKLGARLWADDAPEAKRARLDAVSEKTTSGSLGFRIAGMRVWQGEEHELQVGATPKFTQLEDDTLVYNKLFGRNFTAETVVEGFKNYLLVPSAGVDTKLARKLTKNFLDDIREMEEILVMEESRMYSSSILLAYEGDGEAYLEKEKALNTPGPRIHYDADTDGDVSDEEEDEEEEEEEEEEEKRLYAVKLIDFAHASWVPGLGPDENMLRGIRSIIKILEDVLQDLS